MATLVISEIQPPATVPLPWRFMLPLTLFTLSLLAPACGIQCYECVHNNQRVKRHNRFVYPCSEFDGSNRYIMNCPDSRLCIYQRITLTLSSENIMVITKDGCTPNVTDHARYAEAGLVKEGCIQHKSAYKPPSSEYCYCGYDLCNNASSSHQSLQVLIAVAFITIFLHCLNWKSLS
ncbi:uncharacterized protein LOC121877479 [Homarus americanus]|uniref:uncharacterized protein LOC121877479 n=1 Tax=Homarus americanus TaxID=6706 RepID=UPI001C478E7B|nr:uncharacterized protein LOC121877479 [Homarus americanus]